MAFDHFAGDDEFFDAALRGRGVHRFEQKFFEDHHQTACADFAGDGLARDAAQSIVGEAEFDVIVLEFLLILFDERVLRFGQDSDERGLV